MPLGFRESQRSKGSARSPGPGAVTPQVSQWVRITLLAAAVLAFSVRSGQATNGVEPVNSSLQARSRGGADAAVGDTALSQIENPASLRLHPRPRFDGSAQMCFPIVRWESPIDGSSSQVRVIPIGDVAVALPFSERLSFGLAVHSRGGLGSRFNMRHLLIPWMSRQVGAEAKTIGLLVSGAYQVTERLSVGAGVRAEATSAEFSLVLGPADLEFGRGTSWGGGFQLGTHYRLRDDLSFGLAYRSPTWGSDLAGGRGRASLFGLLPVDLGAVHIEDMQHAQKITAGLAWDATTWLKLIGEVRWINYANSSEHSLTVRAKDAFDVRLPLRMGFEDQWVFILGSEFKLDEHWILGVGYNYGTNPVHAAALLPMGSVLAQHHVTVGLRYETDKWWAGLGYVIGLPASLRGDGHSSNVMGLDYAYSTLEQTQHSILMGFGFRW